MAHATITPHGDVVLVLSAAETRGLYACADEGAAGLFADKESLKAYVGNKRAQEDTAAALNELGRAVGTLRSRGGR